MKPTNGRIINHGGIAIKGVKGLQPTGRSTRPHVIRIRLSDTELEILQSLNKSRNCNTAQLIRDMIKAVAS